MQNRFAPQEIWSGTTHFHDVLTVRYAVATHGDAGGQTYELWAFKSGTRLSSSSVGVPTISTSVLVGTDLPGNMTSWDDMTHFQQYAATQLSGTLEFFKHKVN